MARPKPTRRCTDNAEEPTPLRGRSHQGADSARSGYPVASDRPAPADACPETDLTPTPPAEPETSTPSRERPPGVPWTVRVADWSARHRWLVFALWFVGTIGLFAGSLAAGGTNSAEAVSNDDRAKYEAAEAFVVYDAANVPAEGEEEEPASAQFLLIVTNPDGTVEDPAIAQRSATWWPGSAPSNRRSTARRDPCSTSSSTRHRRRRRRASSRRTARRSGSPPGCPATATSLVARLVPMPGARRRAQGRLPRLRDPRPQQHAHQRRDPGADHRRPGRLAAAHDPADVRDPAGRVRGGRRGGHPAGPGGHVLLAAFGLLGLYSQVVSPVSPYASQLMVLIGLAVAVDYSLFMMTRFRTERRHGRAKLAAIRRPRAHRRAGGLLLGPRGDHLDRRPVPARRPAVPVDGGRDDRGRARRGHRLADVPAGDARDPRRRREPAAGCPYPRPATARRAAASGRPRPGVMRRPVLAAVASAALPARCSRRRPCGSTSGQTDFTSFPRHVDGVQASTSSTRSGRTGRTLSSMSSSRGRRAGDQGGDRRAVKDALLAIDGLNGPEERSPSSDGTVALDVLRDVRRAETTRRNREIVREVRDEVVPERARLGCRTRGVYVTGDAACTLDIVDVLHERRCPRSSCSCSACRSCCCSSPSARS